MLLATSGFRGPNNACKANKNLHCAQPVVILLVEDHTDTRMVLTSLLGRSGYRIITANRIAEALELLGKMRFDILLTDLGLPDGDGLELVGKAKELQPKIRTIALTARGSEKDHDLGRKAGFDYYLSKPFDLRELRIALRGEKLEAQPQAAAE